MNILSKTLMSIRFIGLDNAFRTIRYTLFRDMAERRYPEPTPEGDPYQPGTLQEARILDRGAHFRFERAELEIVFLAPDLARLSWGPAPEPVPYAIARSGWPPVEVQLTQEDDGWCLESPALRLYVDAGGGLRFTDLQDRLLRAELPPWRQPLSDESTRWTQYAALAPEERIFGLGEQSGALNRRGAYYRLWNTDPGGSYGPGTDPLYMPLPVFQGMHARGSYLVFYENSFDGLLGFGPPAGKEAVRPSPPAGFNLPPLPADQAVAHFTGGMLRYYFCAGPLPHLLERFSELTGRPPLPPRWSLGYHQCRWGYRSEQDIRAVVQGFREHNLPLSAIHLDIDYMDGYRVFTVHPENFPDLTGLARELDEAGVRLVTIVDPGVKQDRDFELFREGLREKVYCTLPDGVPMTGLVWPGWTVFPDFTNPRTREWWGRQYARLLDCGVAGFWHDMNEPSSFAAWGDMTLPRATRHDFDGRSGDHREGHNMYGLLMNRAGYEALRRLRPDRRPWIISRAGWVGQARYAWNWTGDTEASWRALAMTIPSVIGLGLSGQPFSGPDIGGFSGNPSAELYLRSFQMGAFLPFFRTHSAAGTARREPWVFGEPFTSIVRSFLELRMRLLPYLYSLAWEAAQCGAPLVRPLGWDHPDAPDLWAVQDAFLLGSALLVAPALEEKGLSRNVTLPPGGWFDFWDDQVFSGPGEIERPTPLERIPVLVRSGSILPLEEDGTLELHVYAQIRDTSEGDPARPAARIYSDAGDGYGPGRLDSLYLRAAPDGIEITWEQEGEFPFPYDALVLQFHGFQPARAQVDGSPTDLSGGRLHLQGPFGSCVLS